MGAAGTRGRQRSRRRAARPRPARGRLRPAADDAAGRRLLDRRGALGRDRGPPARRHPGRAAPGRLAAALLRPAEPLDAGLRALGGERPRPLGAVRRDHGAGRLLGGLVAVRPPDRMDRRAARGGQPVPDRLRAGRADVRPRRAARDGRAGVLAAGVHDGRRRGPARAGDRVRGRPRGDALHAQLGLLLRRRDRHRVAVAAVAGGARRARGGCSAPGWSPTAARSCSTCRGCRPRSTRRATPGRRGRCRRRSPRSPRCPRGSSATSPRSPSCSPPARASSRCCGPAAARSTARRSRCCSSPC